MDLEEGIKRLYPYATEFGAMHGFPEHGLSRERLLDELRSMAVREDRKWESGRCSGTMYCGDHEHYAFLNEAYGLFSHVNALQRDLCPSMSRMESEIVGMTVAMLHGEAVAGHGGAHRACGVLSLGGTESILNATLAYREKARAERGIDRPRMIWPASAHPAFRKAAHLFGFDVTVAPVDPDTMQVDADFVRDAIDANTVMLVGSACNYPYGTVDPIEALSEIAVEKEVWLHVDGCLGGWMLPWGEELGYPNIPAFDFRLPGVTSISADTHKFGYGPKGGSVLAWRDASFRRYQYFLMTDWVGGVYGSPGLAGSRSGGLIAATWAALRGLGREGYRARARAIFDTAFDMQAAVRAIPELRVLGKPTFCFAFASDAFDIYHVNDFMRRQGWRFNGLQHPDALHMCVTGPQTQPGVAKRFRQDLGAAVDYARRHTHARAQSSGVYGGDSAGLDLRDDAQARAFFTQVLDLFTDCPL
ncbi:pyridoxal phosphate-dependent decarboxylase family protein [Burkholderia thailandensis]|uniref:Sphingosine-1-phosphate lyase n=8 Tax=pseudomallei group TaxID=111527 RepID=Q2T8I7_BURTA|nr:aminotransferase class V-fold PLP-dependent enzyme [Burkholderia thailandensis]ABC35923.1 sphingosine-1-phosphate lyase [Burkholderia thailandensis E264]AHI75320.1 putative sphingosine-1-phosphate lyase [Burkholderia thailandensis 2002721723]AHI82032.1 putative sphingosine-1-phosphate lyase [Burkholderia thailandensis E444]AIP28072.1 putative sphingosine-1-phosphate lyase [Burkholderia thailandensis E264]AIS97683.1 putative sphingosine-1-phosphate lyase [Burkholderia thailandensis MSMB59]